MSFDWCECSVWHALLGPDPACCSPRPCLLPTGHSPLLPLALLLFCKWVLLIMKELMLQKVIFLKDICINNTNQAKKWIPNFLVQNNLTPPLRDHCAIPLTMGSQAALLNHLSCMTRPNHTHKGFNMFACLLMWKRLLYFLLKPSLRKM